LTRSSIPDSEMFTKRGIHWKKKLFLSWRYSIKTPFHHDNNTAVYFKQKMQLCCITSKRLKFKFARQHTSAKHLQSYCATEFNPSGPSLWGARLCHQPVLVPRLLTEASPWSVTSVATECCTWRRMRTQVAWWELVSGDITLCRPGQTNPAPGISRHWPPPAPLSSSGAI